VNVRQAIDDTMALAFEGGDNFDIYRVPKELSHAHLVEMHEKIRSDLTMSDTKLCRWLGWMQASVVSWGLWTLEDMKKINKRNAG
jgi:hypothetical protein